MAAFVAAPSVAQDYPNRPVMLIVNFPPGGSTDAMARIIREPLSQALGQSIIIDNRGGAGGATRAAAGADAQPRRHTILLFVQPGPSPDKDPPKKLSFGPQTRVLPTYVEYEVGLVV